VGETSAALLSHFGWVLRQKGRLNSEMPSMTIARMLLQSNMSTSVAPFDERLDEILNYAIYGKS
jgi:hypothetical protein